MWSPSAIVKELSPLLLGVPISSSIRQSPMSLPRPICCRRNEWQCRILASHHTSRPRPNHPPVLGQLLPSKRYPPHLFNNLPPNNPPFPRSTPFFLPSLPSSCLNARHSIASI